MFSKPYSDPPTFAVTVPSTNRAVHLSKLFMNIVLGMALAHI